MTQRQSEDIALLLPFADSSGCCVLYLLGFFFFIALPDKKHPLYQARYCIVVRIITSGQRRWWAGWRVLPAKCGTLSGCVFGVFLRNIQTRGIGFKGELLIFEINLSLQHFLLSCTQHRRFLPATAAQQQLSAQRQQRHTQQRFSCPSSPTPTRYTQRDKRNRAHVSLL